MCDGIFLFSRQKIKLYIYTHKYDSSERTSVFNVMVRYDFGTAGGKTKGSQTFEGGYFNNFSYFFLSCGLYVNIFYVKYLTQDSTK